VFLCSRFSDPHSGVDLRSRLAETEVGFRGCDFHLLLCFCDECVYAVTTDEGRHQYDVTERVMRAGLASVFVCAHMTPSTAGGVPVQEGWDTSQLVCRARPPTNPRSMYGTAPSRGSVPRLVDRTHTYPTHHPLNEVDAHRNTRAD
jgi:hypothetical protein